MHSPRLLPSFLKQGDKHSLRLILSLSLHHFSLQIFLLILTLSQVQVLCFIEITGVKKELGPILHALLQSHALCFKAWGNPAIVLALSVVPRTLHKSQLWALLLLRQDKVVLFLEFILGLEPPFHLLSVSSKSGLPGEQAGQSPW